MDTKNYKQFSDDEYKRQTQLNWGNAPCGSNYAKGEYLSKEYFDDLERTRYGIQDWQPGEFTTFDIAGKQVLEIGFGMGTDHLSLARKGGVMHGIDITPGNKAITEKRFALYGYQTELITGDAERLPYADDTFDFVYSFGVLHHTPNMQAAIDEVYRVLKPGGKCYIAVYNKNSLFFYWSVFLNDWIINRGFRKYTLQQRISLVEYPNDNPNLVVKLHTKRELRDIFRKFSNPDIRINHLTRDCIIRGNRLFSDRMLKRLAPKVGWYLLVRAEKPAAE